MAEEKKIVDVVSPEELLDYARSHSVLPELNAPPWAERRDPYPGYRGYVKWDTPELSQRYNEALAEGYEPDAAMAYAIAAS